MVIETQYLGNKWYKDVFLNRIQQIVISSKRYIKLIRFRTDIQSIKLYHHENYIETGSWDDRRESESRMRSAYS